MFTKFLLTCLLYFHFLIVSFDVQSFYFCEVPFICLYFLLEEVAYSYNSSWVRIWELSILDKSLFFKTQLLIGINPNKYIILPVVY